MADNSETVLTKYQSVGFDNLLKEQQRLAQGYEKAAGAQDKVSTSSGRLESRLNKLQGFARDLRGVGGFLGNDTLTALGSWADGLSDIGGSIDTLSSKGSKLGKILGIGGAVIG